MIVTCPSGLTGSIRGFKAKEANVLADKAAMKHGKGFDQFMAGCWLETTDPGPYGWLSAGQPVDWSKALICDRFWTLLRIRAATYGENYVFKVDCEDEDCGKKIEWEVPLNELPFKQLPETSKIQLQTKVNRFPFSLNDGKTGFFGLQTGAQEVRGAILAKTAASTRVVATLATRILEVEGVGKDEDRALMKYIGDLDMGEALSLVALFDEADGGVETDIDIECPHCMGVQTVSLPLDKEFFTPKMKKVLTTS